MLDHLDDVDADFLAVYGIDLRDPSTDLDGPAFFARAFRLFAYRGSMREELLIERENNTADVPAPTTSPVTTQTQAPAGDGGDRWVTPDEMKSLFPDLF